MSKEDGYKIRDEQGIHFVTFAVVEWVDVFAFRDAPICKLWRVLQIDFDLKYLTFIIAFRDAPKLQTLESHMWFCGTLRRAGERGIHLVLFYLESNALSTQLSSQGNTIHKAGPPSCNQHTSRTRG